MSLDRLARRRSLPKGHAFLRPDDAAIHDDVTLWYDAFWRGGHLYLVCPRFHGLETVLADGAFRVAGTAPTAIHRRVFPWYEIVRLSGLPRGRQVEFTLDGLTQFSGTSDSEEDSEPFRDLNCAVTLSRNNLLPWIADWALWHVRHHGLQAVLFFDNGSTATTLSDVQEALLGTGLRHVEIVSAPFLYGPVLRGTNGGASHAGRYLQTALLNVARLRFLGGARAVLQCDVDELVRPGARGIFDATARSLLGLQVMSGSWLYPPGSPAQGARHGDHAWFSPSEGPCGGKYCVSPRGPLGGMSWAVHRLEGRIFRSKPKAARWSFWHCRAIASSSWKSGWINPDDARVDPEAAEALGRFAWTPR